MSDSAICRGQFAGGFRQFQCLLGIVKSIGVEPCELERGQNILEVFIQGALIKIARLLKRAIPFVNRAQARERHQVISLFGNGILWIEPEDVQVLDLRLFVLFRLEIAVGAFEVATLLGLPRTTGARHRDQQGDTQDTQTSTFILHV